MTTANVALDQKDADTANLEASEQPEVQPDNHPLIGCLQVIARIFDKPCSLSALTSGLPLEKLSDFSLEHLSVAAARINFKSQISQKQLGQISIFTLPAILILRNWEACVLVGHSKNMYQIIHPDAPDQIKEVAPAELKKSYAGTVIYIKPDVFLEAPNEVQQGKKVHSWFWGNIKKFSSIYSQVAVAAVLINLFAVITPLFTMNVYDRVVPNKAFETLWVLAIGISIVYGFDLLLKTLRSHFIDMAGKNADMLMASQIFEHVMNLKLAGQSTSAGALANNLREFETLRDFFTSATMVTLIDLPFVFLFIAIIGVIGGPIALVPLLALPVVAFVGLILQIPIRKAVRSTFKLQEQKHGLLIETLNNMETLKAASAHSKLQKKWETSVAATAESSKVARFYSALAANFTGMVQQFITVIVIVIGVYLIAAGELTTGGLIASTILTGRALAPLGQIAGIATKFHQSKSALQALNRIMALPGERDFDKNYFHRPVLTGNFECKNICFAYPGQTAGSLVNINLKVKAGEKIGIIGRIGSGKSTLSRLLLGLYDPNDGTILFDDTDMRQIDPADLRRNIGSVPQDVCLFHGSIRENITIGTTNAQDHEIERACYIAGIDDFVKKNSLGYDYVLQERGLNLSGGQRQAITIARALVKMPNLLLLDEPTSSMDNTSETIFKTRLAEYLGKEKTLVLVTHRSSMLSLVERLIIVDAGRIVADGPKDSVLQALVSGKLQVQK